MSQNKKRTNKKRTNKKRTSKVRAMSTGNTLASSYERDAVRKKVLKIVIPQQQHRRKKIQALPQEDLQELKAMMQLQHNNPHH